MLKRSVYSELLIWKYQRREEGEHKSLLIKGAKQVGKTFIAKNFGKEEYESYIYINLRKMTSLYCIFQGEITAEEIIKRITANIPNVTLVPKKTLIILDEIHYIDNANKVLQVLSDDMRYDTIAIGRIDSDSDINDTYIREITMYPLGFEEFLWSYGFDPKTIKGMAKYLEDSTEIPESIHNKFQNLFREYIVVGGMPEAVQDFAKNKDFSRVIEIQKKIISAYQTDIETSLNSKKSTLVKRCYNSIPNQLNNELKKFKYSKVEKGQTKRKYGSNILWIIDAYMCYSCYNVNNTRILPLENAKKDQFKLYINDTGLLTCMYGFETKRGILNDTIKGNVRSAIYENVIAQCLTYNGYDLYYYKPDDNHEVEFIIEKDGEVVPIEVKVGNRISVSMEGIINDSTINTAYKCIGKRNNTREKSNVGSKVRIIPYYLVMYIRNNEII